MIPQISGDSESQGLGVDVSENIGSSRGSFSHKQRLSLESSVVLPLGQNDAAAQNVC